jgi:hypothetical protein
MAFRARAAFAFSALSLLCAPASPAAADPDLKGTVIGTDGKGIPGVKVSLKHLRRYAMTDAEGRYVLDANAAPVAAGAARAGEPEVRGNALAFSVPSERTPVDIRAFDPMGHPVAVLSRGELGPGAYRLDLSACPAASMLFLRARIGNLSRVLRYFPAAARPSARGNAAVTAPLAKLAVEEYDTLQVSKDGYSPDYKRINSFTGTYDFLLGRPAEFFGDPASLPAAKNVMTYRFVNRTNGKYADKDIWWKFTGLKLGTQEPLPSQTGNFADNPVLDLPLHHSGRVTFSLGSPDGEYVDFMEQTADALGWHGNTTRVDAYVLPMAMRLLCDDGHDDLLGEKYEVFYLGREKFFQRYLATVPEEFRHNADATPKRLRITAPGKGDLLFNPGQRYESYFSGYFQELGLSGAKVTTQFAFACQDDFFNQKADLCGAVNRHVAHLPKEQWRNPEFFYRQAPANYYAKFIHDYSFREKAYGFAYDDAAEMAAFSECRKPRALFVAVGF